MDDLWAPWRLSYVAAARHPVTGNACFLCAGIAQDRDRDNLIVQRTERSVVMLNRYPYNNGHLLIAPAAHKGVLGTLDDREMLDLMMTMTRMTAVLERAMKPDGYNVGLNLGAAAGAGLPGHLHWHVVPRWQGDTNFMPVVSDTKVISQSLHTLYDLLTAQLTAEKPNVKS
jgi:ATP adenylyltransferase